MPTEAISYDNTTTYSAGSQYVKFTPTEVLVYSGTTVSKRFNYTRAGNTITPVPATAGDAPQEISILAPNRLVLTSVTSFSAGTRTLTTTYSR